MGRTADSLVQAIALDHMPGPGAATDFGVNDPETLGAYKFVFNRELVTVDELHAAAGNGPKLTELIQRGKGQCAYCDRTIRTLWDEMDDEPEEVFEEKDDSLL